ncbi:hypothetical protein [Clostridium sp. HMP27]|uniref:hypothetical protein n=1 Tax=Clostridium sp. HMP27 TaxID=1487921 RepID=UPI00052D90F6|nr:hypothetical protein [Clostridium sp. HMP27]KGK88012.1 hypothetical protein DP68_08750 [Clostridium sp. HMP27]
MKVLIVLDKTSRFNIDLPEVEAKKLYKNLVGAVVGGLKVQEPITEEHKSINIRKPENITHKEIEKVQATEQISKKEENSEVSQYYPKKLVMIKCPSCNVIATPVLNVKDDELLYKDRHLTCKSCQGELPIGEIKPARYQCPNCNTTASFYVMNDLKEVNCKGCGSLIDLIWHEKKEQYVSANLIK